MKTFKFDIFTPEKQFFSGTAEAVVCVAPDGELCVYGGHVPMTVALKPGELRFKTGGQWKSAYNSEGFMDVHQTKVVIFSHDCEWPEDIDEALTRREIDRRTEQLRNLESLSDYRRTEIELQRMMARLRYKTSKSINID